MRLLLILLTVHFVADFLCQSEWMALNKSKRWDALLLHVTIYACCFVPFGFRFALVTFAAHFVTDAITSRVTSRLWFIDLYPRPEEHVYRGATAAAYRAGAIDDAYYGKYPFFARVLPAQYHWFFVVIGFDQLLHAWQLGLTAWWLR